MININRFVNNKGFTLVEMLVVISILAIVGVIFTEVFFRSIRGNNKAQVINKMKQEGQNAITAMDREIRSADNIICPSKGLGGVAAPSNILVIEKNGQYTRFQYVIPTQTNNGFFQKDNPIIGPDMTKEQFLSLVCVGGDLEDLNNAVILTDNNLVNGVSIEGDEIFTREIQAGQKDSITINFTVDLPKDSPSAVSEGVEPIPFQTTIGVR